MPLRISFPRVAPLIVLAALLAASCLPRVEPPPCPLIPFAGPMTCEVSEFDKTVPCIACVKTSCCAEMKACDGEPETCGCLLLCPMNKRLSQEQCAARCPVQTNATYTAVKKCLETRCDMCPQEHG